MNEPAYEAFEGGFECDRCGATRESPAWVRSLSDEQIVDRADVLTWWEDGLGTVASRFDHLAVDDPELGVMADARV